jgi:hypothetical protein
MAIPKRLRKPLIPALIALVALAVWAEVWYSRRATPDSAAKQQPNPGAEARSYPAVDQATLTPSPTPSATATPPFAPPDQAALLELDKVNLMLRDYRSIAGENPVGTNAEIMAVVMGNNPKGATVGPPEGMKLNDKGELIDRWETPYFFHQLSRDHMEIRSAGADKVMWTDDDPVMK